MQFFLKLSGYRYDLVLSNELLFIIAAQEAAKMWPMSYLLALNLENCIAAPFRWVILAKKDLLMYHLCTGVSFPMATTVYNLSCSLCILIFRIFSYYDCEAHNGKSSKWPLQSVGSRNSRSFPGLAHFRIQSKPSRDVFMPMQLAVGPKLHVS